MMKVNYDSQLDGILNHCGNKTLHMSKNLSRLCYQSWKTALIVDSAIFWARVMDLVKRRN